jgi:hypothetical protein
MKLGLNLGCGTRIFTSNDEIAWCNMDAIERPGVDLIGDWRELASMVKYNTGSPETRMYDIIIAFHTFEHQGCGEQPIKQCWDVLKPGGSLIVCVPDVRKLAGMWLRGELSTQIYLTNIYGPYDGTEESRHRWGFDEETLHTQMDTCAEWVHVMPFDYRSIPGAEIPRDDRWMLCLEAVK